MKTLNSNQLGTVGKAGEDAAADYISQNGYTVVARNVRFGRNEIDLIAEDSKYIVFFEVKTRTVSPYTGTGRFGSPAEAVTYRKQSHILEAVRAYLREERPARFPRIDVLEVYLDRTENGLALNRIHHIRNAFGAHK